MGALRHRSAAVAALLLGILAFAGIVGDSHGDHSLAVLAGHEELPTFAAGHEHPDHSIHIEAATPIEPATCLGCLQKRQRGDGSPAPSLGGFVDGSPAAAAGSQQGVSAAAKRLPASRAPPLA